ncbi:MAG: tRNA(fMet)-specific endonuclease VapC [bacterium ADurb.Bin157]|jgi:predicted nucleic acid-binding protein|nr:MAG: tRNA(fMet)-specific endonuclease VapC [bacterium ADurb.Bin157]
MKTLVDTCIWSSVLRRDRIANKDIEKKLVELILNNDALIIGPIRQEILSGYSDLNKFKELKNKLEAFENLQIINQDYILAAEFSNECRKNGIQGGHIDFLICAVAARNKVPIFTCDNDFKQYSKIIKIELY